MKTLIIYIMTMATVALAWAENITITDARIKAAKHRLNATTGAFMVIANHGGKDDILLSAKTPLAKVTEIHNTVIKNGVATMVPQKNGLVVPAGGTLTLAHGSYHLMMFDLQRDSVVGQNIPITLTFAKAGDITLQATVFKPNFKRQHKPGQGNKYGAGDKHGQGAKSSQ